MASEEITPPQYSSSDKTRWYYEHDLIRIQSDGELGLQLETKHFEFTKLNTAGSNLTAALRESVAFRIGSVPEVEAVYVYISDRDQVVFVWAVIDEENREIRRKIYAKEKDIIDQYPMFEFDFNIVNRRGRPRHSVISDPALELTYIRTGS